MTGAIAAIERHPGRTITAIGTLLVLAYGASLFLLRKPDGRIVVGDAVHYYVYLDPRCTIATCISETSTCASTA